MQRLACQPHSRLPQPLALLECWSCCCRQRGRRSSAASTANAAAAATSVTGVGSRERGRLS